MNYQEYLKSPDIHQAFDNMFERQKAYYKLKNKELGLMPDQVELFSIKMATISTDLHFMKIIQLSK